MPYGEPQMGGDARYNISIGGVDFGNDRIESFMVVWSPDVSSGISESERDVFFQGLIDFMKTFQQAGSIYAWKSGIVVEATPTEE